LTISVDVMHHEWYVYSVSALFRVENFEKGNQLFIHVRKWKCFNFMWVCQHIFVPYNSCSFRHRRMGHRFRFLLPLFSTTPLFSKFLNKSFPFQNFRLEKVRTQNTRIIHDAW
jgi:hypothetical protein